MSVFCVTLAKKMLIYIWQTPHFQTAQVYHVKKAKHFNCGLEIELSESNTDFIDKLYLHIDMGQISKKY